MTLVRRLLSVFAGLHGGHGGGHDGGHGGGHGGQHWGGPGLPPLPPDPICMIGDIHGRLDLLDRMLDLIGRQHGADRCHVITLGDMIDRGPDSAGVVARLMAETAARPALRTCLMGNHERMLLDFLADPAAGRQWLRNGAAATLASYGAAPPLDRPVEAARALRAALPPAHAAWLAERPMIWRGRGIAAVHGGADPARPLSRQTAETLLWGHRDFGLQPRRDGMWVAHGHVPHPAAMVRPGRIALDTGAWKTGVLSAAWLDRTGLRFLRARVDDGTAPG